MDLRKITTAALFIAMVFAAFACASTPEAEPAPAPVEHVERPSPEYSEPPEGFTTMEILAVVAAPEGPVVLLGSEGHEALLPISVSIGQAMAIELRRQDQDFARPLTHDLTDDIMEQLGGEIGKVQIDDLRSGTFFATIYMISPEEIVELDARPSDAIALAVGHEGVPIYVSKEVLDVAGLSEDDVRDLPPADPGDPRDFDDSPTTPL